MTAICTEAQSQAAVRDLFRLYGWEVLKTEEDRFRGVPGLPDLLCTSPHGLQLWLECKRPASTRNPKGRVRKAQRERLTEWRRRGVACCVADGITDTLKWLATVTVQDGDASPTCGLLHLCDDLCAGYDWWPRSDYSPSGIGGGG